MIYYVTEYQTSETNGATITTAFTDRVEAEARYYQILSAAVLSPVLKHGVSLIDEDMQLIKAELAYRDTFPEDYSIYYVLEYQSGEQGAANVTVYTNIYDAEDAYYTILNAARISAVPKHGVAIMTENMVLDKHDVPRKEAA